MVTARRTTLVVLLAGAAFLIAMLMFGAGQRGAPDVAQPEVEDDEVRRPLGAGVQRGRPVVLDPHLVAGMIQRERKRPGKVGIVLDDQHPASRHSAETGARRCTDDGVVKPGRRSARRS
jgi:hypothetical protein